MINAVVLAETAPVGCKAGFEYVWILPGMRIGYGGTLRRECLDCLIPINERHLKIATKEWVTHYNRGRPHSSLGPGFPEPAQDNVPDSGHRHKLPAGYRVVKDSVLGGLHHEYRLVKEAA